MALKGKTLSHFAIDIEESDTIPNHVDGYNYMTCTPAGSALINNTTIIIIKKHQCIIEIRWSDILSSR